jgi:ketosteroid isomerase-like protein
LSSFRPRPVRGAAGAALLLAALTLAPAAAARAAIAPQPAPKSASSPEADAPLTSAAPAGGDSTVKRKATAKKKAAAPPLTPRQRLENEIKTAARKVRAAMVIQDTTTLAGLWSDDYIFTSLSGETYSKEERLESVMSPSFAVDEAAEVLPSEMDIVRVYGNVAVVHSRLGPPGAARSGARGGRTRLLTVWVREKGRWRTVASQATGVTSGMPVAGRR